MKESRVIKFRAWDDREKSMSDPFTLFRRDGMFRSSETSPVTYRAIHTDDVIMQFTGLHDKHGVEIYEGDIVESAAHGVIEFGHGKFGINWDYNEEKETMRGAWGQVDNLRTLDDGYNESIQVIGNIYQNPELL